MSKVVRHVASKTYVAFVNQNPFSNTILKQINSFAKSWNALRNARPVSKNTSVRSASMVTSLLLRVCAIIKEHRRTSFQLTVFGAIIRPNEDFVGMDTSWKWVNVPRGSPSWPVITNVWWNSRSCYVKFARLDLLLIQEANAFQKSSREGCNKKPTVTILATIPAQSKTVKNVRRPTTAPIVWPVSYYHHQMFASDAQILTASPAKRPIFVKRVEMSTEANISHLRRVNSACSVTRPN